MTLTLSDSIVLKGGAGLALWALAPSRTWRLGGLALAAWAAWDYYQRTQQAAPVIIPYAPPALGPAPAVASPGPCVGKGTPGCEGCANGGDCSGAGGKVIPLHRPTLEERMMFYGVDDER